MVCFGVAWLQELRAQFAVPSLTEPDEQQLLTAWWRRLSHALGGLFCASLNFVARSEATALQVTELVQSNPACDRYPASAASPADAGRGEPVRPGGSDGSAGSAEGPGGGSSSSCRCMMHTPCISNQHGFGNENSKWYAVSCWLCCCSTWLCCDAVAAHGAALKVP